MLHLMAQLSFQLASPGVLDSMTVIERIGRRVPVVSPEPLLAIWTLTWMHLRTWGDGDGTPMFGQPLDKDVLEGHVACAPA
jgi:hypothetical protein